MGDKWEAEDNFVSATDKTGQDVPFEKIDVQGTVNVDKIGDYEIVYKMAQKKRKQSFMSVMIVVYKSRIQRFMSAIHGNQKRTLFQQQIKQVKMSHSKKSLFQVKLILAKQAFIQSYTVTKVKKKQPMWPSNPTNLVRG